MKTFTVEMRGRNTIVRDFKLGGVIAELSLDDVSKMAAGVKHVDGMTPEQEAEIVRFTAREMTRVRYGSVR